MPRKSETDDGCRLNEALVKWLTGGDELKGHLSAERPMHYITTTLDIYDIPHTAPLPIPLIPGPPHLYQLTPRTFAWLHQRVKKLCELEKMGKVGGEVVAEMREKWPAIKAAAASLDQAAVKAALATPQTLPGEADNPSFDLLVELEEKAAAGQGGGLAAAPNTLLPDVTPPGCPATASPAPPTTTGKLAF